MRGAGVAHLANMSLKNSEYIRNVYRAHRMRIHAHSGSITACHQRARDNGDRCSPLHIITIIIVIIIISIIFIIIIIIIIIAITIIIIIFVIIIMMMKIIIIIISLFFVQDVPCA